MKGFVQFLPLYAIDIFGIKEAACKTLQDTSKKNSSTAKLRETI